jgi:mono/diheme cytochrome c family protein
MIPRAIALILATIVLLSLVACNSGGQEKYQMTDAQLGLTAQQAAGRRVYDAQCLHCHASYTGEGRVAMSLKGMFQKSAMPSGIPANDERAAEVVLHGKRMMPAIPMSAEQLQALLAYMHTL